MTRRAKFALMIGVAVFACAAGFVAQDLLLAPSARIVAERQLNQLVLSDLEGRPQSLSQWEGRIRVINFWATWCEPCREEVPALVRAHKKFASNSVEIVGIAIDSASKVQQFAKEYSVRYPLLIGGVEIIDITRQLGNPAGGLPFTIIVDRTGRVVTSRLGGITDAQLDQALQALLQSRVS